MREDFPLLMRNEVDMTPEDQAFIDSYAALRGKVRHFCEFIQKVGNREVAAYVLHELAEDFDVFLSHTEDEFQQANRR